MSAPVQPACEAAVAIVTRLQRTGRQALLAGGCVRDRLLGREPKDYDVATDAPPDEVLRLFPDSLAVGKAFGVVLVRTDKAVCEVATFRTDHGYSDGRHPDSVSFTDARHDAERRDFTINALFEDPVAGKVIDYVDGCTDLQQRVVRTVGDPARRFAEDRLRMLRAVRFVHSLGFALDPATAAAIRALAPGVTAVSPERVRQELVRILLESERAGDALTMLRDLGLLAGLLPEVAAMEGQAQPPEFHPEGDVFTHTVLMLNAMKTADARLAYAVLFHDVGKPLTASQGEDRLTFHGHAPQGATAAEAIMRRLRFPSDDIEAVSHCVRNHMRFGEVTRMRRSTLRRLVGHPLFPLELELHRLDCQASHGDLSHYRFLQEFSRRMAEEPVLPKAWINGRDVMALGVPAGPAVGRWLKRAYDLQLEGEASSRDDLLARLARAVGSGADAPADDAP